MKIDLITIEEKLAEFFEKDLRIKSHRDPMQNITDEMITDMEASLNKSGSKIIAPNIFQITLKNKELIDKKDLKDYKKYLQEIINTIIADNNFQLAGPLQISFDYDSEIKGDFKIAVSNSTITSGKTVNMYSEAKDELKPEGILNGYLIMTDESYFPIRRAITTIGRSEDNDLVIDNLRVSRVHAQIRQIEDKHVIFDLDSTSGTKVNGIKIRQHALNPGDVIEIADLQIIYGISQDGIEEIENKEKTRLLSSWKGVKPKK